MDYAVIFDIAFSPSGQQLAVTSNKSTLHIFDIPHPQKSRNAEHHHGSISPSNEEATQKWGFLGRIPGVPRLFSDIYSFASAHFEMGDDAVSAANALETGPQYSKGILGWTSEESVVVVGCGRDARWEKFVIAESEDGKRYCVRDGWKRYLGAN